MVSSIAQKEGLKSANKSKIFYNCNKISIPDKSFAHPGFPEFIFLIFKGG
jgi:hypothetical protein